MRKILAVLLGVTLAGPAVAADLRRPAPAPLPPAATPFNWSGAYFGIQGGYDMNDAVTVPPGFTASMDGGIVGLYAGYNIQNGNIVWGIDGSANWSFADGPVVPGGFTGDVDFKGMIRGRLGVAIAPTLLLYATGGAAVANLGHNAGGGEDDTAWGWTAGFGAEKAFSPTLIGRIDYAYQDYGNFNYTAPAFTATMESHTITLGIARKF